MIINNYIIMLRHIIIEEQGFSTSLNDSFTVINRQNKSISIEKQDQKHENSEPPTNQKMINTRKSAALLNKLISNPQSLYTFSSLYENNHQEHYQPIQQKLSKQQYAPEQTTQISNNNPDNQSKVMDVCKIFNDELHEKQLDRIYFFGQSPEQSNISLGRSTINRYGKLEYRSVFDQNKLGRNILKYMAGQRTQPFKNKLSDKLAERQIRRESILGPFSPPEIMIVSNFQSGNLHSVYRSNSVSNLYFLFLRNDTNTNGYTQWFNFFLKFHKQPQQSSNLRFVIMNISKKILYHPDMKILTKQKKPITISASKDKPQTSLNLFIQRSHHQWKRNLPFRYTESKEKKSDGSNFMMIDFNVESDILANGMDFALTHPYNYSRFNRMITDVWTSVNENKLAKDSLYDIVIKQIGQSVLGNKILAIQIKRKQNMSARKGQRKNVMILARQHSSETVGSFICESILKNLVSNAISRDQKLSEPEFTNFTSFDYYRWYIVPLANPDGVIHGNSRTNIKGYDINRCWFQGCSTYSPETQCISKYINQLNFRTNDFIIDLHGHSRQFGMFTYCAENNRETNNFNQILGKLCPYFKLDKCTYRIQSSKRQTLRAQMYQQLRIRNCITIETSMYGFEIPHKQNGTAHLYPFQQKDFDVIAQSILKSFDYIAINSENEGTSQLKEKNQETKQIKSSTMLMIVKAEPECNAREDQIKKDENVDRDDDSDSNPEGQYLLDEERKILEIQSMIQTIQSQQRKSQVQSSKPKKTSKTVPMKSKSSTQYKMPTQKLNFINLSEIKEKREQKKQPKKSEKKEVFLSHRLAKDKKKNELTKTKQLSNRQLPSAENTLNFNSQKSKTIPEEAIENYNMRKTIRNIYKTVGQRKITSIDKIKEQSNISSQSLKFNDGHLSHKRQIKSLLTEVKDKTAKKVAIQPKTVCMHAKNSSPKNMKQDSFYPQRFLQSTLNINWKLKAQQTEEAERKRKQRIIEQNQVYSHKINTSVMSIKPPGNKETSWVAPNLKSSNKTSNSQLQHKMKKLELHSKKLQSLIRKTNEN